MITSVPAERRHNDSGENKLARMSLPRAYDISDQRSNRMDNFLKADI
jgi:hypothetical protein